ncbi:hypothetical protein ABZP36_004458 [Zizania latifolia]
MVDSTPPLFLGLISSLDLSHGRCPLQRAARPILAILALMISCVPGLAFFCLKNTLGTKLTIQKPVVSLEACKQIYDLKTLERLHVTGVMGELVPLSARKFIKLRH